MKTIKKFIKSIFHDPELEARLKQIEIDCADGIEKMKAEAARIASASYAR